MVTSEDFTLTRGNLAN